MSTRRTLKALGQIWANADKYLQLQFVIACSCTTAYMNPHPKIPAPTSPFCGPANRTSSWSHPATHSQNFCVPSPAWSQEAFDQMYIDSNNLTGLVVAGAYLLGLVYISCVTIIEMALDLDCTLAKSVAMLFGPVWTIPIGLFLVYHRLALPTWLTFGYPVAFGGTIPNNCEDACLFGLSYGSWPCLLPKLKVWLASAVGPEGWTHLAHPEPFLILMMVVCLLILGTYSAVLKIQFEILRDTRRGREEKIRQRKDDAKRHLEAGITSHELEKSQKQ
ncbi:hypothetical protein Q7P37_006145 [Cladosporium fusiforme]